MFYTVEELSGLNRKELQKLCKQFKIKANKKNCELVEDLHLYFITLQNEQKEIEKELNDKENIDQNEWLSEDSDDGGLNNQNRTFSIEKNDQDNQLKNDLLKEVEKRAAEKLSKIPRYNQKAATVAEELLSPAVKKLKKQHKTKFNKMDSIDVYLAKKRKRAEENLITVEQTSKVRKLANKTKPADTNRKVFKTPVFKRVDNEISFNIPSTSLSHTSFGKRTSPRLSVLKDRNQMNVTNQSLIKQRKSVGFLKTPTEVRKSVSRKSIGIKSPANGNLNKSLTSKTPNKFNLEASLKKPLKYKPHTGKLKEVYFADQNSVGMNVTFEKKDVKELSRPKITREVRRNENKRAKKNVRENALAKRRGIVS